MIMRGGNRDPREYSGEGEVARILPSSSSTSDARTIAFSPFPFDVHGKYVSIRTHKYISAQARLNDPLSHSSRNTRPQVAPAPIAGSKRSLLRSSHAAVWLVGAWGRSRYDPTASRTPTSPCCVTRS